MTLEDGKKSGRYPTGRLNLLQSMALLAVLGIVVTVLLKIFFA
jgi:hypothetical protein